MAKYFDKKKKHLLYINQKATHNFWDSHWQSNIKGDILKQIQSSTPFVIRTTNKYLPKGAKVLEGGCGMGQNVYSLQKAGFDVYGIDYASETVKQINAADNTLKVSEGDVRKLDFEDSFFDGYWSLGVIEHFIDGYENIIAEMHRVVKPGGYIFLTVPSMSVLRNIKAKRGNYPEITDYTSVKDDFYQFALNPTNVIKDFKNIGFQLISKQPRSGLKGLKDEVEFLQPILQKLYNSRSIFSLGCKVAIDLLVKRFSNHITLFIFKKM